MDQIAAAEQVASGAHADRTDTAGRPHGHAARLLSTAHQPSRSPLEESRPGYG